MRMPMSLMQECRVGVTLTISGCVPIVLCVGRVHNRVGCWEGCVPIGMCWEGCVVGMHIHCACERDSREKQITEAEREREAAVRKKGREKEGERGGGGHDGWLCAGVLLTVIRYPTVKNSTLCSGQV